MKWIRMAVALVVVLSAWAVGNVQGQGRVSEFKFTVFSQADSGPIRVRCDAGCDQAWIADVVCPHAGVTPSSSGPGVIVACSEHFTQNGPLSAQTR